MSLQAASLLLAVVLRFGLCERYLSASVLETPQETETPEKMVKVLVSGPDIICGGPEIWSLLTSGSDASSVENIKWAKIEKYAEDFVKSVSDDIKVLELELNGLGNRIQDARLSEKVQVMDGTMAWELIKSALDPFDGHEQAKRRKCGKPSARPRAARDAYRQSQADFGVKAGQYFKGGEVRLDGEVFLATCRQMLYSEDSYCGELCQKFKDKAQEFSDAEAGEISGDSDALVKKQVKMAEELKMAKSELHACDKARASLEGFKTQLLRLKAGMNQRFEELQDAEYALDDAQFDLADFEKRLEADEERLSQAEGALADASIQEGSAQGALEAAKEREKAALQAVVRLTDQLAKVRSDFEVTKNIDKIVSRLKMAASLVTEGMRTFREKAVLDPLRGLGFDEDLALDESFPTDPKKLEAASKLGDDVKKLQEFCREGGEAAVAFEQVRNTVNLFPLCEFDSADKIMEELSGTMVVQVEAIKQRIAHGVLSAFDPYRGNNGMTAVKSAKNVEEGELKGLQEIVGPYSESAFYSSYLQKWKLKGSFLNLIAKLSELVETLDKSLQALEEELEAFEHELREAQRARKMAVDSLELASKAAEVAAGDKKKLEQQVLALFEEGAELAQYLDRLRAAVAQARERYLAARQKLVEAHSEGTEGASVSLPEGKGHGVSDGLRVHSPSLQ